MIGTGDQTHGRSLARDARFDDRFIVGAAATGIYCLPSCEAETPPSSKVIFRGTEEEAKRAGFRPCLVCRPDLFYRDTARDADRYEALVKRAAREIESVLDVTQLAALAGVDGRRLDEIFRRHGHSTPAEFLRAARIERASRLLADTRDDLQEIGFAAGFESTPSFYREFKDRMGLSPSSYRNLAASDLFVLQLPRSYIASAALDHATRDPFGTAERVHRERRRILKAIADEDGAFTVDVTLDEGSAACVIHHDRPISLAARLKAHAVVLRMLGVSSRAAEDFESRAAGEVHVAALLGSRHGLRLPQTASVFEALVWAILGQQVTISFAAELRDVLILAADRRAPFGLHAHPTAEDVAKLEPSDLARRRFSRAKAEYIVGAARAIATGELALEDLRRRSAETAQHEMQKQRGIGIWTARYTLLRGAGFGDFAPIGDSGLAAGLQALHGLADRPSPKAAEELMQPFSPHRSIATAHIWAMAVEIKNARREAASAKGLLLEERLA
jgi:AraC family transcriptional regulator of adaptative response / DNA-3-methyladenine glycosylase II